MKNHRSTRSVRSASFVGLLLTSAIVAAQDPGPQIELERAVALIAEEALVIDVRSSEEIEQSGIVDYALNIAHTEVEVIRYAIGDRVERPVVLYCGSGRRAGLVIDALTALGYQGLVNGGGYQALQAAVESSNAQ